MKSTCSSSLLYEIIRRLTLHLNNTSHFYRVHYAFTATVLYQCYVVDKEIHADPKFLYKYIDYRGMYSDLFYLMCLSHSYLHFCSNRAFVKAHYPNHRPGFAPQFQPVPESSPSTLTLSSSNVDPCVTRPAAYQILADHHELMKKKFVLRPRTGHAEEWRVVGVMFKADSPTEYDARFVDLAEVAMIFSEEEVVKMLLDSEVVS